jgi:hypothetical protein
MIRAASLKKRTGRIFENKNDQDVFRYSPFRKNIILLNSLPPGGLTGDIFLHLN